MPRFNFQICPIIYSKQTESGQKKILLISALRVEHLFKNILLERLMMQ